MEILENPSPQSVLKIVDQAIRDKKVILLVGSCIVNYQGRAGSVLPQGERVIMLKPDGSLLVHQKEKREPVNWNPPRCKARARLTSEGVQILSTRSKPREALMVLLKDVKLMTAFDLVDDEELCLTGSEKELIDIIFQNPGLIEEGFKPLEREKPTKYGLIDLYGVDAQGKPVIIEFKRRKAEFDAVSQLKRYVTAMEEKLGREVRGILAAPGATSRALNFLKKHGLDFIVIKPRTLAFEKVFSQEKVQRNLKEFTD